MTLFPGLPLTQASGEFQVETPLGIVRSFLCVNGVELSLDDAQFFGVGSDGSGAQWLSPLCLAECVLLRHIYFLQEMYPVADCRAFLWRVRLTQPIESLRFSCRLSANQTLEVGPESGQYLAAQTWENENVRLTIGTEDEDAFSQRAERGDKIPTRYAFDTSKAWKEYVDYSPEGFDVNFREAEEGDEFQIHFAIAWTFDDKEAVATWFAVDTNAESILAGAGHAAEASTPDAARSTAGP